jgi:hypothetical protein
MICRMEFSSPLVLESKIRQDQNANIFPAIEFTWNDGYGNLHCIFFPKRLTKQFLEFGLSSLNSLLSSTYDFGLQVLDESRS